MRYNTVSKTDSLGTSADRTRLLEVIIQVILRIYKFNHIWNNFQW